MVLRDRSTADATRFNQIREELKNSKLNKVDTRTPLYKKIATVIALAFLIAVALLTN